MYNSAKSVQVHNHLILILLTVMITKKFYIWVSNMSLVGFNEILNLWTYIMSNNISLRNCFHNILFVPFGFLDKPKALPLDLHFSI